MEIIDNSYSIRAKRTGRAVRPARLKPKLQSFFGGSVPVGALLGLMDPGNSGGELKKERVH